MNIKKFRFFRVIYSTIKHEIVFFGNLLFRVFEILIQVFPSNSRGCKIRGAYYSLFLKSCGHNFQVGLGVRFEGINKIEVGNDVYIGPDSWICGLRGGIVFEDQVMLGPKVIVVSTNHLPKENSFRFGPGKGDIIKIGKGTWVGGNVIITEGVKIGYFSLIAAGTVVTKSFEACSIIYGVPGKCVGKTTEKYT